MKVCARILSRLLVVLAVTACAAEAAPTEVSITEERQPTTDPAYYPLDTRTGLTEIDTVLAAVEDGDPQPLRDLFTYTKTACMTVHALGGPPPCREGEAEGSRSKFCQFWARKAVTSTGMK